MGIFQHEYYTFIEVSMKFTGLWPFQSIRCRAIIFLLLSTIFLSQLAPLVVAIAKNFNDIEFLMESVPSLIFIAFVAVKHLFSLFNSHKMLILLNFIRTDWEKWAEDHDINILHEYTQRTRKITIMCAVIACTTGSIYVIQPIIPKIVDVLLHNGSEPGEFPLPVDYHYIDMQKYYFSIILHGYFSSMLGWIVSTCYDCIFMVIVQHCCGLFAMLGRKLERTGQYKESEETGKVASSFKKSDMEHLVSCIGMHCHAIEYAELIEETYTWGFLTIMGLNIFVTSLEGIRIVTRSTARHGMVRHIACIFISTLHLYIDSSMAQSLMDHSTSIRYYIFNANWYSLPLKAQKVLLFMMMRCNTPCQLTAGRISIMSVETFGAVLKTTLSYFTLLKRFV